MCAYFVAGFLIFTTVLFNSSKANAATDKKLETLQQEEITIPSRRALWLAYILRDKPEETRIPDLEVVGEKTPVYLVPQGNSFRPLVKLTFKYAKEKGALFINKKEPIRELNSNGEYVVYAYLQSRISTLTLTAKQQDGSTKTETFYLFAPEAREYKTSSLLNSISFTLGHSFLVYRQSSFGTFVSQSLLVGARYLSPETGRRLGLYGDAYLSVYTYASSPIDSSPQLFEGRAGGSYSLKLTSKPKERSRLNLGVSTVNVYSFSSPFGFSGLFGPELGFRSEYYQNAKNSYAFEFSFTPYEWGGEILDERSIKITTYLNRNLDNLRRMQLGMSYSSHRFSADTEDVNIDLLSLFFSLSF